MKLNEEFGLNLNIQPPVLETGIESDVSKLIHKASVQMLEDFENICVEAICEAAKENGINSLTLLNKKTILEALERQTPRKPVEEFPVSSCPRCMRVIYPQMKYCCECGQKFDWNKEVQSDD